MYRSLMVLRSEEYLTKKKKNLKKCIIELTISVKDVTIPEANRTRPLSYRYSWRGSTEVMSMYSLKSNLVSFIKYGLSMYRCTTNGTFFGIWFHLDITRIPDPLADAGYTKIRFNFRSTRWRKTLREPILDFGKKFIPKMDLSRLVFSPVPKK